MRGRRLQEVFFRGLMVASVVVVLAALVGIVGVVVVNGGRALSWEMVTQAPSGG